MSSIKALLVEDSEDDALLLINELERGGIDLEYERVETFESMSENLESGRWDIVFCDYKMPKVEAIEVLSFMKAKNIDLPLIIVSGVIGDDLAVEMMKAGACDYLKKDNLVRLVSAVKRELNENMVNRRNKQLLRDQCKFQTLLRAIVENFMDGIFIINEKGIISAFYPSAEKILGYRGDEVIGKNVSSLISESFGRNHYRQIQKYLVSEEDKTIGFKREIECLRKDGSMVLIDLSINEMWMDDKRMFVGLMRDMTAINNSQEKLQILSTAVDCSPSPVCITDINGKIEYVNASFVKTTGYSTREAIGQNPRILSSGKHSRSFYRDLWDTVLAGKVWSNDICNKRKNGQLYWELNSIVPLRNAQGVITHFVSMRLDETMRRQADKKLKEYACALEISNQALQNFASIASRDLQEPLRKVVAFGDRLREKAYDLDEQCTEYLARMQKAALSMKKFIEDLQEYSRLAIIPHPFSSICFENVLNEVVSNLEVSIQRVGAKIEIHDLPQLPADRMQMCQLFQNLISNSLKFQNGRAAPYIVVNSRRLEGGGWEIKVSDNGIGFEEKSRDRIFEPFVRLNGRSMFKGSGIGLAICKKIMECHGGTISAKSKPDEGSVFTVLLPEEQSI